MIMSPSGWNHSGMGCLFETASLSLWFPGWARVCMFMVTQSVKRTKTPWVIETRDFHTRKGKLTSKLWA